MTVSGTIPLLISAFRDLIFFPCKVVLTFFPKSLGEARKTLPRYAFLPRWHRDSVDPPWCFGGYGPVESMISFSRNQLFVQRSVQAGTPCLEWRKAPKRNESRQLWKIRNFTESFRRTLRVLRGLHCFTTLRTFATLAAFSDDSLTFLLRLWAQASQWCFMQGTNLWCSEAHGHEALVVESLGFWM